MLLYMYSATVSVHIDFEHVKEYRLFEFTDVKGRFLAYAQHTIRQSTGCSARSSVPNCEAESAAVGSTGAQPPQGPGTQYLSTYPIVGEDAHEVCLMHLPTKPARARTIVTANGVPTLVVITTTNWCSLEGVCMRTFSRTWNMGADQLADLLAYMGDTEHASREVAAAVGRTIAR